MTSSGPGRSIKGQPFKEPILSMSAVLSAVPDDFGHDRQVAQLRIPPHSIESESSVLGGLLLDNAPGTGWAICWLRVTSTAMNTSWCLPLLAP
jgi:hypothetical protein